MKSKARHPVRLIRDAVGQHKDYRNFGSCQVLADLLHVSESYVRMIEEGTRPVTPKLANAISKATGCNRDELLKRTKVKGKWIAEGGALDIKGRPYTAESFRSWRACNPARKQKLYIQQARDNVAMLLHDADEAGAFDKVYDELLDWMMRQRRHYPQLPFRMVGNRKDVARSLPDALKQELTGLAQQNKGLQAILARMGLVNDNG